MIFSQTAVLLICSGVFLSYFCYRRFREYRRDRNNYVNYHYWIATLMISLGFFFYGIPSLLNQTAQALSLGTLIGSTLNVVGFIHFFIIPLYTWLPYKNYIIGKYLMYLIATIIMLLFVLEPPPTALDTFGTIHWNYNWGQSLSMMSLLSTAFILNIILILKNIEALRLFSPLNTFALIMTFCATGLGGAYMYTGDNRVLLEIAAVLVYIGVSIIFFASVSTAQRLRRGEEATQW